VKVKDIRMCNESYLIMGVIDKGIRESNGKGSM
jgi:hypothetical protein